MINALNPFPGALLMKRLPSTVGMLGLALFRVVTEASANIVYMFSGVTFDDGGTSLGRSQATTPSTPSSVSISQRRRGLTSASTTQPRPPTALLRPRCPPSSS